MFKKIMAPVDLAHADKLQRALDCASDLAKHFDAELTLVGVTSNTPGKIAHNPDEFAQKLDAFAGELSGGTSTVKTHTVVSHDPSVDVDDALLKAVDETGADLVVMASHVPGVADYIWPSNGGKIAGHAKCSVMVVRL